MQIRSLKIREVVDDFSSGRISGTGSYRSPVCLDNLRWKDKNKKVVNYMLRIDGLSLTMKPGQTIGELTLRMVSADLCISEYFDRNIAVALR